MRVCKMPGFLRQYFTASDLSGWPAWVDVGGSVSSKEQRRLKRLKRQQRRKAREKCAEVQPIPVQWSFN